MPSSFVRAERPTKILVPTRITSPPSRVAGSIIGTTSTHASSAVAIGAVSARRDGAPGRVIKAVPSITIAVSSTNTQSGHASSAGSVVTATPHSIRARAYAACCRCARATSIGGSGGVAESA
jgi:hypothetical protein